MKPATSDTPEQSAAAVGPGRDPDELLPEYDPALIRSGERGKYAVRYARGARLVPRASAVAVPGSAELNTLPDGAGPEAPPLHTGTSFPLASPERYRSNRLAEIEHRRSVLKTRLEQLEAEARPVTPRFHIMAQLVVGLVIVGAYLLGQIPKLPAQLWPGIAAGIVAAVVLTPLAYWPSRYFISELRASRIRDVQRERKELDRESRDLLAQADPLQHWAYQLQDQAREYYSQTRDQARSTFLLAMLGGMVSLGITVVGVLCLFRGQIKEGALTAAVGFVGQSIAAVVIVLYNRTLAEMARYHERLVTSQHYGVAVGMAQTLSDGKDEAIRAVIEAMVRPAADKAGSRVGRGAGGFQRPAA